MDGEHPTKVSLITFLAIMAAAVFVVTKMIAPYLLSLILGSILALLAYPLYRRLQTRHLGPKSAASIVTIGIILLVVGPILSFAAMAIRQGLTFLDTLKSGEGVSMDALTGSLGKFMEKIAFIEPENLQNVIQQGVQIIGKAASSLILAMAKSIPEGALQMFLASLACYFFLIDGPRFLAWMYGLLPLSQTIKKRLATVFQDTAISVVWASMAAAGTQGLIMFVAFISLNIPAAFLAGGTTFIFAFIPILGSTPVWLGGALYLYLQGMYVKMVIMLFFGVCTGLADNFVRPWVLKGRGEMHPLVSLVAIFGGIQMFGLFGVFLGPILAAILITLLQIWPVLGRRAGVEVGHDSFDRNSTASTSANEP